MNQTLQAEMTNVENQMTKEIPSPNPETPNPQSAIDNPQAKTSVRCLRQRLAPRDPPSARNVRVYVEVAEKGRTQRDVAREEGIGQPQVCRIVQSVEVWIVESGGSLEGHTPKQQLHLAVLRQKRELNRLLADTERMMERAEQPYDSLVKVGKNKQGEKEELWKIIRREPPRVGFPNLRARILERLAKLAEAESELRSEASAECGMRSAESGVPGTGGSPASAASTPQSALRTPQSNPRSRIPPHPPALDPDPLPDAPAAPLPTPNWLAYPRCREPHVYDEPSANGSSGKPGRKKSYLEEFEPYAGATTGFMARYWRYQALGLRQGLFDRDRRRFVDLLLGLDRLAEQAQAAAWAELFSRPPEEFDPQDHTYSTAECRALRCVYLSKFLELDFFWLPADERRQILEHFDPASGELRWWPPGRIAAQDQDLTWILGGCEGAEGHMSQESEERDQESGEMTNVENQMTKEIPNPKSEIRNPQFDNPHALPPDRGPDVPLPEPAAFTRAEREDLIDTPGNRVAAVLLRNCFLRGRTLADFPIDQEQVIIYQAVEEVIKDDEGAVVERVEYGRGEMSNDENQMTKEIPNPKSEIRNLQSDIGDPQSNPHAHIPSPLTPALRDEIFARVGIEGVAVFGLDGTLYEGKSLGQCGLRQRGVLFLRELAHSRPYYETLCPPPPNLFRRPK
jgi:hypothetical protein